MNATLQSFMPYGSINPMPMHMHMHMHMISNYTNFIKNREELNILTKNVKRAINESEKRFEMKVNEREYTNKWVEKLKISKREIFFAEVDAKMNINNHDRYDCRKNISSISRFPEMDVVFDNGKKAYAKNINNTLQDNDGITPLMKAIGNNDSLNKIRDLIHSGVSLDIQDKQNNTAVIWLIKSLNNLGNETQIQTKLEIMENLFLAGANLTIAGTAGFTPMMYAVAVNSVPAFKMSYRSAEDFRCVNDAGETSLHLALKYDADPKILTVLIDLYKFMNVKDTRGYTPFMMASFRSRYDIMDTFLTKGGDINDFDAYGWTALMHAVNCDDVETMNYLLAKGASVLIKDCCNKDALNIAQEQGRNHMVNLLLPKIKVESETVKGVKHDPQLVCGNICNLIAGPRLNDSHNITVHNNTQYEIIDIEHREMLTDVAASAASRSVPFTPMLITRVMQGIYDGVRKLSITQTFCKKKPV
ncbi:ankyrin repeat domain-containing protein [Sodalis sp. RH15]|uniref:ankyrin repeat domain-containing protein n=1 Tax=Sodalis sp. RH15 TaxID=3394330 RepID=UPI0039B57E86